MMRIILASTSAIRAQLLRNAGVEFNAAAPGVDEERIKAASFGTEPGALADVLAREKATAVSQIVPDALVIGADQVLALDNKVYGKPETLAVARRQLENLSGKTHTLETAAAGCRNGRLAWSIHKKARLTMRPLSPEFLDRYLACMGHDALTSVGAYKLEGHGAQLFAAVEGDYFAVLGLPLLEVLQFLRAEGALPS